MQDPGKMTDTLLAYFGGFDAEASNEPSVAVPLPQRQLWDLVVLDLSGFGVQYGDRIGLLLPSGATATITLLAVMARYCAVPLNPAERVEAHVAKLECSSACCLVTLGDMMVKAATATAAAAAVPLVTLDAEGALAKPFRVPNDCPPSSQFMSGDDIVLILHTSGTSSRPKRVPFTLKHLICSGTRGVARTRSCRLWVGHGASTSCWGSKVQRHSSSHRKKSLGLGRSHPRPIGMDHPGVQSRPSDVVLWGTDHVDTDSKALQWLQNRTAVFASPPPKWRCTHAAQSCSAAG